MKNSRIFTLIVLFTASLFTFNANAQQPDALLDKIVQANQNLKNRNGSFSEVRQMVGKAEQKLDGELVYEAPSVLTMNYSDPNEYFSINANTMSLKREGKARKFDLTKNKPMKTLSQLLLSSFNGNLRELATTVGSSLNVEETKDAVIATLQAQKKAVKGYSKVILKYDSKTYHLLNMVMEEFDGSVTTYTWK